MWAAYNGRMQKDFTEWHRVKQGIQDSENQLFPHEREVRWCSVGLNVGSEEDGNGGYYTRPVLIVKIMTKNTCLCVPLTTRDKHGSYYFDVDLSDGVSRKAVLSQIRLIDTRRLWSLIGTIDIDQFEKIKKALIDIIK
jgi:mRNA-degrading endonuclease toxin of MazEF toxin-antitoxin module